MSYFHQKRNGFFQDDVTGLKSFTKHSVAMRHLKSLSNLVDLNPVEYLCNAVEDTLGTWTDNSTPQHNYGPQDKPARLKILIQMYKYFVQFMSYPVAAVCQRKRRQTKY